jgi:hypothetical protein
MGIGCSAPEAVVGGSAIHEGEQHEIGRFALFDRTHPVGPAASPRCTAVPTAAHIPLPPCQGDVQQVGRTPPSSRSRSLRSRSPWFLRSDQGPTSSSSRGSKRPCCSSGIRTLWARVLSSVSTVMWEGSGLPNNSLAKRLSFALLAATIAQRCEQIRSTAVELSSIRRKRWRHSARRRV